MLKETALAELHRSLGGKLVDFGGWNMPLHYGSQIDEHHTVRNAAGMFDVSHMTVVDVRGPDASLFLRTLLANDVEKLKDPGKALYTGMLNERGGVIDDLIVYLMEWGYRMVVNCATREKDLAWIEAQAVNFAVTIQERPEFAIIAVQGPEARAKVEGVVDVNGLQGLKVFQGLDLTEQGKTDWFVARTGYTGEDGYEMILPESEVEVLWQALCAAGVKPCGLGARDTLRLEAGMNLYGHEMDEDVSPLVANMGWTIAWKPEERNFIGRQALQQQREDGLQDKLVGLVLTERGVMRAGQEVVVEGCERKGVVTSGTFSPTLAYSIALARVPREIGSHCEVIMRNKGVKVAVVEPSFVRQGKKVF